MFTTDVHRGARYSPATSRDNSHNCPAPLYPANSVSLYRCCIQLYPLTRRLENWASIAHDSLPRVKGQIRHHLGQESHGQNGFVVDSLFTVRRLYAKIQLNHTLVLPHLSQIMLLTTKLKLQNLSRDFLTQQSNLKDRLRLQSAPSPHPCARSIRQY